MTKRTVRTLTSMLLLLILAACSTPGSNNQNPPNQNLSLNGTYVGYLWFPGEEYTDMMYTMALNTSGTTVSGWGALGQAGAPEVITTISGTINGKRVNLTITDAAGDAFTVSTVENGRRHEGTWNYAPLGISRAYTRFVHENDIDALETTTGSTPHDLSATSTMSDLLLQDLLEHD